MTYIVVIIIAIRIYDCAYLLFMCCNTYLYPCYSVMCLFNCDMFWRGNFTTVQVIDVLMYSNHTTKQMLRLSHIPTTDHGALEQ